MSLVIQNELQGLFTKSLFFLVDVRLIQIAISYNLINKLSKGEDHLF